MGRIRNVDPSFDEFVSISINTLSLTTYNHPSPCSLVVWSSQKTKFRNSYFFLKFISCAGDWDSFRSVVDQYSKSKEENSKYLQIEMTDVTCRERKAHTSSDLCSRFHNASRRWCFRNVNKGKKYSRKFYGRRQYTMVSPD